MKRKQKRKVEAQRLAFAIKACRMMGKDVELTAKLLNIDESTVRGILILDDANAIDWDAEI